eukprot:TRINITY_DN15017_c0_g1_i1.p1 TRINITY_DN15017_c0_g1~~TRINITY_DN15017_c0_g1_i1.p1  ORF type:complete len:344 (+),score=50.60 TRINITY_DN15017_c0_g1_i1:56-1033(+)
MKATSIALILAVLCVSAFATKVTENVRQQFAQFAAKHEKVYGVEEYERRVQVFADNLVRITALNKMDKGATYAVNKFADLTEMEFRDLYLSKAVPDTSSFVKAETVPSNDIPAAWDWTNQGAVTPVKNQGQCGSCWAFSTTGNVEGQWFLTHKNLPSLSEQQLVDCDKTDDGCSGGLPSNAYEYIMGAGGLMSEDAYPYTAVDGNCVFQASQVISKVANWTAISTDETVIAQETYERGPLSIGINAEWMQFYSRGVSDPLWCDPKKLDHGVLIVGYGTDGSSGYWKIKNSWGPEWGEQGYYRIIRGKGKCGLNTMVTSAIVPESQ